MTKIIQQKNKVVQFVNLLIKYNIDLSIKNSLNDNIIFTIIRHINHQNSVDSSIILKTIIPLLKDPFERNIFGNSPLDLINQLKNPCEYLSLLKYFLENK